MRHPPVPGQRIVLLGASNVTLAFPVIFGIARALCDQPLEVLGAFGHGRSYGERRAVLWRELPGIADCGLWKVLHALSPAPTLALVTDIGNDVLFDVPVPQIVGWVETCLDHLQAAHAKTVLTPLPLRGIKALSRARYLLLRTVLFPGCRLPLAAVLKRAFDLDERLRGLALKRGVLLAEPRSSWYGFDCIHIRRRHWESAWREILSLWSPSPPVGGGPLRLWDRIKLRMLSPERRWLFGRERCTVQPAGRLPGRATVSLY